jgi:hypothetical protein
MYWNKSVPVIGGKGRGGARQGVEIKGKKTLNEI